MIIKNINRFVLLSKHLLYGNSVFVKNFLRYSITSLMCRGLVFVIAPITIAFLSPSEFGLLSLTNSFIVIMTIIIGLGLRHVLSLEYVHCNSKQQTDLIETLITIFLLISLPLLLFLFIMIPTINNFFFCGHGSWSLIGISIAVCFCMAFIEFYQQVLQFRTQISLATHLQFATALVTIALTILFLSFFHWGVVGVISAQLIGIIFIYGPTFFRTTSLYCNKIKQFFAHKNRIPYYLKLSLPFIPSMLCNWIIASGDRWFLARYDSFHAVGIYTLADACASLFHIIISNSVIAVYLPHLLHKFARNKDKIVLLEKRNKKIMYISMFAATIILTLGYLMAKPILSFILPYAYHEALDYIWFTFIGYILLMGTYFSSILIQFHKKVYFLAFSLLPPALINMVLNRILIPYFSIYGCIIATAVSYLLYFLITLTYNYLLLARNKNT